MCVLSSSLIAGGLSAIGATGAAASTTAVAVSTVGANALLGAGISTALGAAMGARGGDLGRMALIGAGAGGAISGAGMLLGGVTTVSTVPTTLSPQMQLAMGMTDAVPGMINQGAEVAALMGNPTATTLPATAQLASTSPGLLSAEAAAYTLSVGKAALALGGAGFQAYSSIEGAKEDAKALKSEAKLNEVRAGQVHEQAALEKAQQARRTRGLIASQKVASAANGVMLEARDTSSPAMFEQDARAELAWDGAIVDYNANREAWGYMEQARIQRQQARGVRRAGNLKAVGSLFTGALGAGLALA